MEKSSSRFLGLLIAIASIILLWELFQTLRETFISVEPRLPSERPPLANSETQTIALFEANKNSVVYISTAQSVVDVWTRNNLCEKHCRNDIMIEY